MDLDPKGIIFHGDPVQTQMPICTEMTDLQLNKVRDDPHYLIKYVQLISKHSAQMLRFPDHFLEEKKK